MLQHFHETTWQFSFRQIIAAIQGQVTVSGRNFLPSNKWKEEITTRAETQELTFIFFLGYSVLNINKRSQLKCSELTTDSLPHSLTRVFRLKSVYRFISDFLSLPSLVLDRSCQHKATSGHLDPAVPVDPSYSSQWSPSSRLQQWFSSSSPQRFISAPPQKLRRRLVSCGRGFAQWQPIGAWLAPDWRCSGTNQRPERCFIHGAWRRWGRGGPVPCGGSDVIPAETNVQCGLSFTLSSTRVKYRKQK